MAEPGDEDEEHLERGENHHLTVEIGTAAIGDPDLDHPTPCPACGFDSVVAFPLYAIDMSGVTSLGHWAGCVRCWDGP